MIDITKLKKSARNKYKHMNELSIVEDKIRLEHEARWIGAQREMANERLHEIRKATHTDFEKEVGDEHTRFIEAICYGAKPIKEMG